MYPGIKVQHDSKLGATILTGHCILTGNTHYIYVKTEDFCDYSAGKLIQRAFPYLSDDEREFLISGIGPGQFDNFVGEEDEDN